MGGTREFLNGMGVPVDGDDPTIWDEVFGSDREPPQARRYSTAKAWESGPYRSWEDFLARTSESERMRWCALKSKKANALRLMSGAPEAVITAREVWKVLENAQGRCRYCGSLALEKRPSDPKTGAPRPWEPIGRRVGSIDHRSSRFSGGANAPDNLAWTCLWCNTWTQERTRGALDHGGYYPPPPRAQARGPRSRSRAAKRSPVSASPQGLARRRSSR